MSITKPLPTLTGWMAKDCALNAPPVDFRSMRDPVLVHSAVQFFPRL
jgi:hypothetical protein